MIAQKIELQSNAFRIIVIASKLSCRRGAGLLMVKATSFGSAATGS